MLSPCKRPKRVVGSYILTIINFTVQFFFCQCMTGCVAAITTLGGKSEDGQQRIDYIGNSNVIEQAGILGVERIILVTRYYSILFSEQSVSENCQS